MIFNILNVLMVLLALATVLTPHVFRSAIYLMGVLSLSAGLYLLLGAEFLAGVQVLVYVGGILVLLVFAVMLTQSQDLLQDHPSATRKFWGAVTSIGFLTTAGVGIAVSDFSQKLDPDLPSVPVADLGRSFLSTSSEGYLVPFELISILLLTVLIAGVVVAKKEKV